MNAKMLCTLLALVFPIAISASPGPLLVFHLSDLDSQELTEKIAGIVPAIRKETLDDATYTYERRVLKLGSDSLVIGCVRTFRNGEYLNDGCVVNFDKGIAEKTQTEFSIDEKEILSIQLKSIESLDIALKLVDPKDLEFTTYEWILSLDLPRLFLYCEKDPAAQVVKLTSCAVDIVPNKYPGDVQYEDEFDHQN